MKFEPLPQAIYVHQSMILYESTEYSVFTVFYLYSQSSKDSTKTQAERMEPSDTSVKCSTEGK